MREREDFNMIVSLWKGKRTIKIDDKIANEYRKMHGWAVDEIEACGLLASAHIHEDTKLPDKTLAAKVEELLKEDMAVNRRLKSAPVMDEAMRVMKEINK